MSINRPPGNSGPNRPPGNSGPNRPPGNPLGNRPPGNSPGKAPVNSPFPKIPPSQLPPVPPPGGRLPPKPPIAVSPPAPSGVPGFGLGALTFFSILLTPPGPLSDGTVPPNARRPPSPNPIEISPPETPQPPVYPFTGGQDAGILYEVWIDANGSAPGANINYGVFPGPIRGIVFRGRGYGHPVGLSFGNNEFFQFGWSDSYAPIPNSNPDPIITLIRRIDGQPDNTNPPPIVPGVSFPPTVNIVFNQETVINNVNSPTFGGSPPPFPTVAPRPAASPPRPGTGTGTGTGTDPVPNTPPRDDRQTDPPILIRPIPFGVPVSSGSEAEGLHRNVRINDPVIESQRQTDFNPITYGGDGTVINPSTITPPTASPPPNIDPPTDSKPPPSGDTTTRDSDRTTQAPPLFTPVPSVDPTKNQPIQREPEPPKVEQTPPGNSCCVPSPVQSQLGQLQNQVRPSDLIDWSILTVINNKLGPQINGGLSGFLKRIDASRMVDRALNIMGTAASLHNAAMLSRNIGETLGQTVANLLAIVGIKDADDQISTFTQAISQSITNTIKGAIGESNYTALSETWAKANRIYQSAINAYQLMTDSVSGLASGLEQTAKYTGQIGNALRKSGVVLENSYQWMSEAFNFRTGKLGAIDRVIRGLDQAQEVASDLESITGEFRNVTENINQIGTEINTIRTEIQGKENEKNTQETTGKTNSQSPAINNSDLNRPEG